MQIAIDAIQIRDRFTLAEFSRDGLRSSGCLCWTLSSDCRKASDVLIDALICVRILYLPQESGVQPALRLGGRTEYRRRFATDSFNWPRHIHRVCIAAGRLLTLRFEM